MRVVFSRRAEHDLEEIGDYIAQDNPRRALNFIEELRAHCARIADAPLAFPLRPELGSGLRSSPHGRYVIFFRPSPSAKPKKVLIVRILHGARDLPRQIKPG